MDENKSIATAEIPDNASCEQNQNEQASNADIPATDVPATEADETKDGEITPEEAEVLENSEEETTAKKKSKKKAVAIVMTCIFLIGLIGGGLFGGYTVINKRGQQLLADMTENADAEALSNEYRKLGALGQKFFHQAIVEKFVEQIKNNPYKAPVELGESKPANAESINKYKKFKATAEVLEITEADTNAIEYIEKVLVLEKYIPYNEVTGCMLDTQEIIQNVAELMVGMEALIPYIGRDSEARSLVEFTIQTLGKLFDNAISECSKYDTEDELCKSYIETLQTVKSSCDSLHKVLFKEDEINKATDNLLEFASTAAEKSKTALADTKKIPDINTVTVNQKEG